MGTRRGRSSIGATSKSALVREPCDPIRSRIKLTDCDDCIVVPYVSLQSRCNICALPSDPAKIARRMAGRVLRIKFAVVLYSCLHQSLGGIVFTEASKNAIRATFAAALSHNVASSNRAKHRQLDIVVAHYDMAKVDEAIQLWSSVLQAPAVSVLAPHIFLYCQNNQSTDSELKWFSEHGEIVRLENVGRESHVYLWHIVHHYGDLARHTLFHQDVNDPMAGDTMLNRLPLLKPQTGMLALSFVSMCNCNDCYMTPIPKLKEIWAMAQQTFCSPDDVYPTFWKGAFLVSSRRILDLPRKVYASLLEYLEAPADHWVHAEHPHEWGKNPSSPVAAHVLERSWNLLFDCMHLDGPAECAVCAPGQTEGCPLGACECLDPIS